MQNCDICLHCRPRSELHKPLPDGLGPAGSVPLYLELLIPSGYPDVVPQPDLANLNNAPYAPAVKEQAVTRLIAEVSSTAQPPLLMLSSELGMHIKPLSALPALPDI